MNAATVIRSCRGAGYRVVLLSGQVFFPPLHPGMCAPLPEELKEAARQRSEDLVVRLTWEGRAETLINESHQRLNAVESFPRDGWLEETPFWLRYEDDLDEAFMAGDMDSLKALLDEREEMVAEMYGV